LEYPKYKNPRLTNKKTFYALNDHRQQKKSANVKRA